MDPFPTQSRTIQGVPVQEGCLGGIGLFRVKNLDTNGCSLVFDLLHQQMERDVLEVLVVPLTEVRSLLPTLVSADDDGPDLVLDAELDQPFRDMMEVVLDAEVPFLAVVLVRSLVEPSVPTLDDATVDQYGRMLI